MNGKSPSRASASQDSATVQTAASEHSGCPNSCYLAGRCQCRTPPSAPPVFIDYYPEQRTGLVTLHESWAVDDGYACYGNFPTKDDAVTYAKRQGWQRIIVRSDKPTSSAPEPSS